MLYWIFDLDHTLYSLDKNERFSYFRLNKNAQLETQLNLLPCRKILFTNGTIGHAIKSLEKLGILHHFRNNIHARDTLNAMKPGLESFDRIIEKVGIKPRDKVVFFEDTVENLVTSKGYNWITVLISPRKNLLPEVDFTFPNCNVALNFFLMEIIRERRRQALLKKTIENKK